MRYEEFPDLKDVATTTLLKLIDATCRNVVKRFRNLYGGGVGFGLVRRCIENDLACVCKFFMNKNGLESHTIEIEEITGHGLQPRIKIRVYTKLFNCNGYHCFWIYRDGTMVG